MRLPYWGSVRQPRTHTVCVLGWRYGECWLDNSYMRLLFAKIRQYKYNVPYLKHAVHSTVQGTVHSTSQTVRLPYRGSVRQPRTHTVCVLSWRYGECWLDNSYLRLSFPKFRQYKHNAPWLNTLCIVLHKGLYIVQVGVRLLYYWGSVRQLRTHTGCGCVLVWEYGELLPW